MINEKYKWICGTIVVCIFLIMLGIIITANSSYTLEIYANDEMVATSKNAFQVQRDTYFNECLNDCKEASRNLMAKNSCVDLTKCYESCVYHYSKNISNYVNYIS